VPTTDDWKHALRTLGYPQPKRAERRIPSGLAAMYGSDSAPKLGHIKKISTTGLFLATEDRWPVGEVISMTLQREAAPGVHSEFQVDVRARVASYGEDGVGLGFVLPDDLNSHLWEVLVSHADAQPETEDISFLFRVVRIILFLHRLCPSAAKDIAQSLGKELDDARTRSGIEIALRAEKLLADQPDADHLRIHPQILKSILKHGSWSNDDLVQQLWAGLLASSCTVEGTDESNHDLVELLVHITETQARILVAACSKVRRSMSGVEGEPVSEIIITPEEMTQITGIYDRYRLATEASYLFNFGLIERAFDFTTYIPKDSFHITPTSLGLELLKACKAGRA
jgi:hypothetical protein